MTVWHVEFSEPAEAELADAYLSRSRVTSPPEALRWHEGLRAAIRSLAEWPRRCARVESGGYGYSAQTEIRRLRYGQGRAAWHVVYQVIEPRIGPGADPQGIVRVLHVVSAVRRPPGERRETNENGEGQE